MSNSYLINGKQLSFDNAQVMAIINITPDSFYDGGRFSSISDIVKDAEIKIMDGAAILDIGAASSRSNATPISVKDEIFRLREPIKKLRKEFPKVFISVDTYLSEVADFAISEGADLINDISGGQMDSLMFEVVAKNNVGYVLMHMQGTPQTMQRNPEYNNVVESVSNYFKEKISIANSLGLHHLILDVGFGFGKKTEHNYQLLKGLNQFLDFGYPLLAGLSRKSMINNVINTSPETALNGTSVLNTLALQNGASLLRVHDVKEAKQTIDLFEFYKNN